MEQKKVFEFSLCDAWNLPIRTVMISEGEKNTVLLSGTLMKDPSGSLGEMIEISDAAMTEIKRIILESGVLKIDEVEENEDVFILDGYIHEFCFAQDGDYHTIEVFNLDSYQKYKKKYPKAASLIQLLHDMKMVLQPEGINGVFFILKE